MAFYPGNSPKNGQKLDFLNKNQFNQGSSDTDQLKYESRNY